jgi:hypothetical protein
MFNSSFQFVNWKHINIMKLVFVQQQLLCILSPKSDTNQFAKTISLRFSKHYLKWNTRHIWCNFRRLVMRYQAFTADLALFKKKWHTLKYNIWHFITGQYEFIPNNIEASFFFFLPLWTLFRKRTAVQALISSLF